MKKLTLISVSIVLLTNLIYSQSVDVKDSSDNPLITITDEGTTGSITFPSGGTPDPLTNKLYNEGGTLKWNGNAIGFAGSADGDWTISSSDMYSTVSGNVGIGTINPLSKLSVGGDGNSSAVIHGESALSTGSAVSGYASNSGTGAYNSGGNFQADGEFGRGVSGVANGRAGNGVRGSTSGTDGTAVFGYATGSSGWGVHGMTEGSSGRGVYGEAAGPSAYAGYFNGRGYFSNNVGIGTTNPSDKLHVVGNMRLTGGFKDQNNSDGLAGQILSSTGTTTQWINPSSGADNLGNHTATQDLNMNSYEVRLNGGWLSGDGGEEGIYVTSTGNVGVGLTTPASKLSVGGSGTSSVSIHGETVSGAGIAGLATGSGYGMIGTADGTNGVGIRGFASNTGNVTNYGGHFESKGGTGYGIYGYANHASGANYGIYGRTASSNGWAGYFLGRGYFSDNVGIGVNSPSVKLHVKGLGSEGTPTFTTGTLMAIQQNSTSNWAHLAIIASSSGYASLNFGDYADDDVGYVRYGNSNNSMLFATSGSERLRITSTGNVGIGTTNPIGKLDVNGTIYQRGIQIHADYVFEDDYELESIQDHSDFMWTNKHLPAVPKAQKDENGLEIVEVGAHRKGIVEELEKAHIYIAQLEERIRQIEELIALKD